METSENTSIEAERASFKEQLKEKDRALKDSGKLHVCRAVYTVQMLCILVIRGMHDFDQQCSLFLLGLALHMISEFRFEIHLCAEYALADLKEEIETLTQQVQRVKVSEGRSKDAVKTLESQLAKSKALSQGKNKEIETLKTKLSDLTTELLNLQSSASQASGTKS